ncbi:S-DNA-T family DNA segregation ATPase FtsK/SpoIIIE [Catenuloplanes nepalensis]|uniref:S-DNA-T family DNA segregation ATPase FtsK/SpoIIIE n=1 Tax=Catenuloplanes nepalensis TaxID=587533 RepID=A0ABT9MMP7_9ACTN|nr:FtsK/SpoIIIE domain-containing protein [Catenuloplanes nepalensis]MDP9792710.1 S-DNA-T family DNA segregation ATPase FtsK/SpoIIIE [Catenuloplanes nepalensis]
MRINVSVATAGRPEPARVVVDADPHASVGSLTERLHGMLGAQPGDALFVGERPVPPERSLAEAGLDDGAALGLGTPATGAPEPGDAVELRIVGGPGAGRAYRLRPGQYRLGSGPAARIRLAAPAPEIGPDVLVRADRRVFVLGDPDAAGSRVGAGTDGDEWPAGGQLVVGANLLELATELPRRAPLTRADGELAWEFNRPPRFVPTPSGGRFRLPAEPRKPERNPIPFATLLLAPAGAALIGILATGSWRFVFIALLSPVAALLTLFGSRKRGRVSFAEQVARYQETLARVRADADAAVLEEEKLRRHGYPDPAMLARIAMQPTERLWERRRADPDFLELRAGTADVPSGVTVEDPAQDEHRRSTTPMLDEVPVPLPVARRGVVGLAGPGAPWQATWLVAQAAVLHSPADVRVCVLTDRDAETRWSWLRWLPHAKAEGDNSYAMIGSSTESVSRRIAELNVLLAARAEALAARQDLSDEPAYLVVLDGARRLRSLPGVVPLLRDGPAAGIFAVCVEPEERLLPEECRAVLHSDGSTGTLRSGSDAEVTGLRVDQPETRWYEEVARGLAPLRATGRSDDAVLPAASRLLDVLGLEPPSPEKVRTGWNLRPRSTQAVLGIGLDGEFAVDLVRDGPHALIAGTTGAGKSELLQTLVATLAVANRPDEMTFVLVDYKGGSAFAECEQLPHTVGMVTDLDTHLVERALTSLGAELRRREHMLAAHGAPDIVVYHDRRSRNASLPPLPRLVIVIDEFASMVRELPTFVTGLVNIAQRGRSLGIHLVLATQRPSGAVTPDIRANTNLRIALRTTDPSESRDIIDAPDAGELSPRTPGRAFARLSYSALLPFQAGRIGGPRPSSTVDSRAPSLDVAEISWAQLAEPPVRAATGGKRPSQDPETDLKVLVRAIRQAAADAGIDAQPSPWLPALPAVVQVSELDDPLAYGIVDLPADQRREPLRLDLDRAGHLYVLGSARSGRSQVLRTLAGVLAQAHSAAGLHLYGIDCGNGALLPMTGLPHCGAVVDRQQTERLDRMLDWFGAELTRRQARLGESGAADLAELRAALPEDERPPHIVLMLDRFEVYEREFVTFDNGRYMERLVRLLRDGAAAGVHLIVAGDKSLGAGRYAGATEDKLVLRLNDRADYSSVGVDRKAVPPEQEPGRAIRHADTAEAQVAVLGPELSGAGQAAALTAIAQTLAAPPAGRGPRRFGVLPDTLTFAEALARQPAGLKPLQAIIGVGGDELAALGPDLGDTPTFLIGGPPRSGRSTALLTIARSLLTGGTGVVVVAPRRSPLRELAGEPGVIGVIDDSAVPRADFQALLTQVTQETGAILIDDAELMAQSNIDPELLMLTRGAAGNGWGVVAAGNAESLTTTLAGWLAQARRNRTGMLLSPQSMADGEVIGVRLPRGIVGRPPQPGRGHLHLGDGSLTAVQVPRTT